MTMPTVSVVIPAYNNAVFLGETIQSVLRQTYPHFELVVVNDASPDNAGEVVAGFSDPRIRYVVHEHNRGLSAARNSGIRASSGELIALLDGDDLFHPEKLRQHVEFHEQHPEIGVTYNARFELDHSRNTIRELWRPPLSVDLVDLVQGYPFGPSDMVLRREWAFRVNLFDEQYTYFGEDLDINCRLGLAGCTFASVDRALNYRRYHSGRVLSNLQASQEAEMRALMALFNQPACPERVLAVRHLALTSRYLGWANAAFAQSSTALGQADCLEAVGLDPSLLRGKPCRLATYLVENSILDESEDHEAVIDKKLDQLPPDLQFLRDDRMWMLGQGYLLRGARAVIWGRVANARGHFGRSAALGVHPDEGLLARLAAQALSYEGEFGAESATDMLRDLSRHLNPRAFAWLRGRCAANRAFRLYQTRKYRHVPTQVLSAIRHDRQYLANRGLISVLARSVLSSIGAQPSAE